jgi:hypothetical protein
MLLSMYVHVSAELRRAAASMLVRKESPSKVRMYGVALAVEKAS